MQTKLWKVIYDREYITNVERYDTIMKQWPHKGKNNSRPVYVAADSKEEAENKIREELNLPFDLNLYIEEHKSYALSLVII